MKTKQLEQAYIGIGFSPSKAKRWANRPQKRELPFVKQKKTPQSIWSDSTWNLLVVAAGEMSKEAGAKNGKILQIPENELRARAEQIYKTTNRAWRRARLRGFIKKLKSECQ